jgi:hypothetical protein
MQRERDHLSYNTCRYCHCYCFALGQRRSCWFVAEGRLMTTAQPQKREKKQSEWINRERNKREREHTR